MTDTSAVTKAVMKSDVPLLELFSTLPRCPNGMKGGGPPATSERAVSRVCAASD